MGRRRPFGCPCCGRRGSPTRRPTRAPIASGAPSWSARTSPARSGRAIGSISRSARSQGQGTVAPLVSVADPAAIVEAVKLADDRSGDVIVRLYEAHGGRVRTPLTTSFPLSSVEPNDLLERPIPDVDPFVLDGQTIDLRLGPFEIATLRLRPARQPGRTSEGRPG